MTKFETMDDVYMVLRSEFFDRITLLERKVQILETLCGQTVPNFKLALDDQLQRAAVMGAQNVYKYPVIPPDTDPETVLAAMVAQEASYNRTLPILDVLP